MTASRGNPPTPFPRQVFPVMPRETAGNATDRSATQPRQGEAPYLGPETSAAAQPQSCPSGDAEPVGLPPPAGTRRCPSRSCRLCLSAGRPGRAHRRRRDTASPAPPAGAMSGAPRGRGRREPRTGRAFRCPAARAGGGRRGRARCTGGKSGGRARAGQESARARTAGGAAPSPSPPGPRRPRNRRLLLPRPKGGPTQPRRRRALPRPAGPAAPRRDPAPPHPGPVAAAASAPSLFPSQLPGRHLTFNPLQPITALPQPRESAAPKPRESSGPRPAPRLKGAWPRRGAGRVRPLEGALRRGACGRGDTGTRRGHGGTGTEPAQSGYPGCRQHRVAVERCRPRGSTRPPRSFAACGCRPAAIPTQQLGRGFESRPCGAAPRRTGSPGRALRPERPVAKGLRPVPGGSAKRSVPMELENAPRARAGSALTGPCVRRGLASPGPA